MPLSTSAAGSSLRPALGVFARANYDVDLSRVAWCTGLSAFAASHTHLFANNSRIGEILRIWAVIGTSILLNNPIVVWLTAQTGGAVIGTPQPLILGGARPPGAITDVNWAVPPADRVRVGLISARLVAFEAIGAGAPLFTLPAGLSLGFQSQGPNNPSATALLYSWD